MTNMPWCIECGAESHASCKCGCPCGNPDVFSLGECKQCWAEKEEIERHESAADKLRDIEEYTAI